MSISLPPRATVYQSITVPAGRTYEAAPGSFLDVIDFDAEVLSGNGWLQGPQVGPSSGRPSKPACWLKGEPPRWRWGEGE
jgi:hypothetical protein